MNLGKPSRRGAGRGRATRLALAVALSATAGPGCTREFFRNWADQDVTEAVFEKSRDPRNRFDMFTIEPPALSRFANPYDPDRPPAPPDDRAAEALSPVPQWPHHRLISPTEGTGYLDELEKWRRERPIKRPVDPGVDDGPAGTPGDLAPPPPRVGGGPPEAGNLGTGAPPLSPTPGGDAGEIAPPDPRGVEGIPPPAVPPPAVPPPAVPPPASLPNQPQASKPDRDRDVRTAAFQVPGAADTDPGRLPASDPGQGVGAPPDPRGGGEPDQAVPPALAPEVIAGEAGDVQPKEEEDLIEILKPQVVVFDEGLAAGVPPEVDPYIIDPRQALTLALQNSRGYQFNLEDVYLSGLAVTLERFRFEPQFAAGMSPGTPTAGGLLSVNPGNSWIYRTNAAPGGSQSLLSLGTAAGFGKLFSTGMRVAGGFANQTIVNLGGPSAVTVTSQSFMPLSVQQAFLKDGGRAVTLEALTQAERNLLYQVRTFTQFRREFVVSVLAGGGITGGSGDPTTGFLTILQLQQQVENNTKNVAAYERVLEVFQELGVGAGSSVRPLDIVNVELQLQQQRNSLVQSLNQYRNQLDSYKIQLGLPPDTPVIPDSSLLKGFRTVFDDIDRLTSKPRATLDRLVENLPGLQELYIDGRQVIGPMADAAATARDRRPIEQRVNDRALIQGRIDRLRDLLDREAASSTLNAPQLEVFRRQLEREEQSIRALGTDDAADREAIQRLQEKERLELVKANQVLEDVLRSAERVALENRPDLMNARAQLYDQWRQLAVRANALQGVFTVGLSNQYLSPSTSNNPFDFNDQSKQFSLTFNAELPLVRLSERNAYITAHVNYERRRRTLMQVEDQVKNTVRQDIRNLQFSYQSYEITKRRYVASLATQDQSFQSFLEPPRAGGGAASTGGTLVLSLINALSGVLNSQNTLISTWVQYQQQRLNLYRDLAIMPYDEWEAFYELFPSASTSTDASASRDAGASAPPGAAPVGGPGRS